MHACRGAAFIYFYERTYLCTPSTFADCSVMHACRAAASSASSQEASALRPSASDSNLPNGPPSGAKALSADACRPTPSAIDSKEAYNASTKRGQTPISYPCSAPIGATEAPNLAQSPVERQQGWEGSSSRRGPNGCLGPLCRAHDKTATIVPHDITNGQDGFVVQSGMTNGQNGVREQKQSPGVRLDRSHSGARPGAYTEWGPGSASSPGRVPAGGGAGSGSGAHPASAPSPLRPVTNQALAGGPGTASPKPSGLPSKLGRTASGNSPNPAPNGASARQKGDIEREGRKREHAIEEGGTSLLNDVEPHSLRALLMCRPDFPHLFACILVISLDCGWQGHVPLLLLSFLYYYKFYKVLGGQTGHMTSCFVC